MSIAAPTLGGSSGRDSSILPVDPSAVSNRIGRICIWCSAAALLLCGVVGCSSSASSALTFTSAATNREFQQRFSDAFYRLTSDDGYDVVLVEDGMTVPRTRPGKPIQPSPAEPLHQLVHVRVLWRPMDNSKPDAPTATNATIDWYVGSNAPDGDQDYLHYRGAGFVVVYPHGDHARFVIRSSRLTLTDHGGDLQDPLGDSGMNGVFIASRNDGRVAAALAAQQPPAPPTAASEGAPPRTPMGP